MSYTKNEGIESLRRSMLLMSYDSKKTLSENVGEIKFNGNHTKKNNKDFVFDFVITENHKYVILMDQVFVEGGGGKSIGSIWENTHIFTEILKETVSKIDTLTESVKDEINYFFESIVWDKESISEWIEDNELVTENLWDRIKTGTSNLWQGVKNVGNKIVSGAKDLAMKAFKQGILPFLRWIRRNAMTNIGIVIDIVVSILFLKTNAAVWALICLIDIYEIYTGEYDPKEPDRMTMPFFYLLSDLIAVVFTAGSALLFRKAIPVVAKQGVKGAGSVIGNLLKSLLNKIPAAKNFLKSTLGALKKAFPSAGSTVSRIGSGIDNVMVKLESWLQKLVSPVIAGVAGLGFVKGVQKGIEYVDPEGKLGSKIQALDTNLQQRAAKITGKENIGQLAVPEESRIAIQNALDDLYAQQAGQ